jgi:uridine kinase
MKKTYTEGRPPWFTHAGKLKQPMVIGIAGGSGSGKTTVCKDIIDSVKVQWVAVVSMDNFYKGLTVEQKAHASDYNFDHPNAFDFDLLAEVLQKLKEGKSVQIPVYCFKTHSRLEGESITIYGADVIIMEGIFVLYDERLRSIFDIKLFVDTEDDIRLARRLQRDIVERGRTIDSVLEQYERFVKPAFDEFINPTKQYADIVIPRGASNKVAITIISQHLKSKLLERGYEPNDNEISLIDEKFNIDVLECNQQVQFIHTIIRDEKTERDDFIFYSDRLSRLAIEHALNSLPFEEKIVTTPTGKQYVGLKPYTKICGINIMRAGDSMLKALRSVVKDVIVGSILIQSDNDKIPKLFFYRLPKDISEYYVMLLDPIIGSGRTVSMAIRLLLDHGIKEDHIKFVTLIANPIGLNRLYKLYPQVRVVCSMVDEKLNQKGHIIPGIGNFGDRYYGTEPEETDL